MYALARHLNNLSQLINQWITFNFMEKGLRNFWSQKGFECFLLQWFWIWIKCTWTKNLLYLLTSYVFSPFYFISDNPQLNAQIPTQISFGSCQWYFAITILNLQNLCIQWNPVHWCNCISEWENHPTQDWP